MTIDWTKAGRLVGRALLQEKQTKYNGGLYYYTQISMTYNSNRIEGSRLSEEHTRTLFETKSILPNGQEVIYSNDVIEASNHFKAFDYMLEHYEEPLSETLIKHIQGMLVMGTDEANEDYFNVGDYKSVPNMIGMVETTSPSDVPREMNALMNWYHALDTVTINDIVEFHERFESIHPFQNGNGRTGRIIMFKECMKHNITPFIITEDLDAFYKRGLREYKTERGYLRDTCLLAQDRYAVYVENLANYIVKN